MNNVKRVFYFFYHSLDWLTSSSIFIASDMKGSSSAISEENQIN